MCVYRWAGLYICVCGVRAMGEKPGRRDGRVGADEVGTAMALRGEHEARSASTQEEERLN